MSEKNSQLMKTVQVSTTADELRPMPFVVAGLICFIIAVFLGSGSWYFFGSHARQHGETTADTALPSTPAADTPARAEVAAATPSREAPGAVTETTAAKPEINGLVQITGGEITLGGGDTKQPLERLIVGNFSISETEVTNSQYAEFIKAANHPPPPGWNKDQFPEGTGNYPVTNVSWQDAVAFCRWMEKKIGLPVRLPTEAEWELAARGTSGNKYPWGNEWKSEAAISKETGGKISAVKSFPLNRSPFGVFDMAGNVWEWTQDKVGKNAEVTDAQVKEALEKGQVLRIVKGGSASEKAAQISTRAKYEIPENTKVPTVGFRYVIERK